MSEAFFLYKLCHCDEQARALSVCAKWQSHLIHRGNANDEIASFLARTCSYQNKKASDIACLFVLLA